MKINYLAILFCLVVGCRGERSIIPSTDNKVTHPDATVRSVKGFFLLNEGNMGSNKSTLDYFDYSTGIYTKNIYAERNPGVVKELGDVGNDIAIYGDKLYAVINCSNFVEVMEAASARHIAVVSIPNCRYVVFDGGFAYVSSYAGPVSIDPNARRGYVAKVDTATLTVVGQCVVGYQPEQMAVVDGMLYVANSGGYRVPNYDRTISVVDLATFTEVKQIDVAINLHQLLADQYGRLWVSSRGDYYKVPSQMFVVDSRSHEVTDTLDLACSTMTRSGDSLYVCGTEWNYTTGKNTISYALIDTKMKKIVDRNFIKDGTHSTIKIPYGVAVNPLTHEIFITDAKDYVTPGALHCYSSTGVRKWSVTTGDIPAHITFTGKQLTK